MLTLCLDKIKNLPITWLDPSVGLEAIVDIDYIIKEFNNYTDFNLIVLV